MSPRLGVARGSRRRPGAAATPRRHRAEDRPRTRRSRSALFSASASLELKAARQADSRKLPALSYCTSSRLLKSADVQLEVGLALVFVAFSREKARLTPARFRSRNSARSAARQAMARKRRPVLAERHLQVALLDASAGRRRSRHRLAWKTGRGLAMPNGPIASRPRIRSCVIDLGSAARRSAGAGAADPARARRRRRR